MELSGPSPSFDLKGRKILIVDDDRINTGVLGGILQGEGCALAEAGTTAQALAVYATFLPDLVLLAGKGHETYQVLKDQTIPFDDRVVAREVLKGYGFRRTP